MFFHCVYIMYCTSLVGHQIIQELVHWLHLTLYFPLQELLLHYKLKCVVIICLFFVKNFLLILIVCLIFYISLILCVFFSQFFFFFFWQCHAAWGIFVPQPGIKSRTPAVETQSPNPLDHQGIFSQFFNTKMNWFSNFLFIVIEI